MKLNEEFNTVNKWLMLINTKTHWKKESSFKQKVLRTKLRLIMKLNEESNTVNKWLMLINTKTHWKKKAVLNKRFWWQFHLKNGASKVSNFEGVLNNGTWLEQSFLTILWTSKNNSVVIDQTVLEWKQGLGRV